MRSACVVGAHVAPMWPAVMLGPLHFSLHVVQYALSSEVVSKLTASMCLDASACTVATVSMYIS